ncbi:hypothetical protein WAJ74_21695, partial [Acinetobacter baumannii]
ERARFWPFTSLLLPLIHVWNFNLFEIRSFRGFWESPLYKNGKISICKSENVGLICKKSNAGLLFFRF